MDRQALAVVYRPKTFDDVIEQDTVKAILQNQISTNTFKSAYLFCGAAGTGKTTCARIFANEINQGHGNAIELDAASHNSVDDVRNLSIQAKSKAINSEYKVFIIDECHTLSNSAWQAMLKLIEEPPAKTVFIFCTTDPQKIPKTILSRVQRYDFQRISFEGILERLTAIVNTETGITVEPGALNYIAKLAEGGMRDAITLMDKCISYNPNLTYQGVAEALGVVSYDVMFELTKAIEEKDARTVIECIEEIYQSGKNLKQFIKMYLGFVLDINKYILTQDYSFTDNIPQFPNTPDRAIDSFNPKFAERLLTVILELNSNIKWETAPKVLIEAVLVRECVEC